MDPDCLSTGADTLALRESEEHFREMAENIDEVFFWRDPQSSRPSYVSRAYERIWGQPCESVYTDPSSWIESIHPEDRDRVNGAGQMEYRIIRPDGEVRWIWTRTVPVRSETGEVKRIVGIAQDFTDRKHAEETRAFLASIVESSEDAIIGTLLDATIASWNQSAERLFGYTAGEAIGKSISILFPVHRQQEFAVTLKRIGRAEQIERFESIRARKDGTLIDVAIIISPVRDATGKTRGVSGIYRDISALKRTSAELVKAKEAAEGANRAKSEFLANMSHEIRTPMNGILGLTDVVLDTQLDAEQRECLSLVKTSAESLLAIINDILDVSKIEAGKMVLQMREFWLRDLMRAVVKGLAVCANEKHLELICNIQPDVPEIVLGDSGRLRQVLINLVGNAIKFTNAGEVVVSVETLLDRANTLHFSVRDTGLGIPPEKQGMIFAAFTQVDGSHTRRFGGTGLGLTIAARLVEMMGGRIWVESDGRAGSTFHFTAHLDTPLEQSAGAA